MLFPVHPLITPGVVVVLLGLLAQDIREVLVVMVAVVMAAVMKQDMGLGLEVQTLEVPGVVAQWAGLPLLVAQVS